MKIETSPSDKALTTLVTRMYDGPQLLEISMFLGSIDELNVQYPIECIRKNEGTYRVAYLGVDSIAIIIFDNHGNRIVGNIYHTQKQRNDFCELVLGQSLAEVREIDPSGEYLFLYTGRNDTAKISSHYTIDGYLITIEYDALNTIISINEELI